MTKNNVVQGDLVAIEDLGRAVKLTLVVEKKTVVEARTHPVKGLDEFNLEAHAANRSLNNLHLGIVSVGQGVTAYHELEKA